MTTVQLFSGGLDSLCVWLLRDPPPAAVYVTTGADYETAELRTLDRLTDVVDGLYVQVVPGPSIGSLAARDGHVPHRNLNLLAAAAAHTGADRLTLGAVCGEGSPDKTGRFLRAASRVLTASEGRPVTVQAPARRMTKTQLVEACCAARGRREVADLLPFTRSCYTATRLPCGRCQACFRRDVALYRTGLSDRRPQRPAAGLTLGPAHALHLTPPSHWVGMLANNAGAAAALAGLRTRRGRRVHDQ